MKGGKMLKIRVFLNNPCGLTGKRLQEIMPRLGQEYEIAVEEVSRSREAYQSEAYQASGLPPAPAVVVEEEVAAQGPKISTEKIEAVIRRRLGLPPLRP